jgi:site-specific DNA recombinase
MQSGCSRLFPVVPGCGGRQPGQIRDKIRIAILPIEAQLCLPAMPFRLHCPGRRRSRRRCRRWRRQSRSDDAGGPIRRLSFTLKSTMTFLLRCCRLCLAHRYESITIDDNGAISSECVAHTTHRWSIIPQLALAVVFFCGIAGLPGRKMPVDFVLQPAAICTSIYRRRVQKPGHREAVAGIAASYSRYSSDLQDASSIDQQRRRCREAASRNGQSIPSELEFADEAISGTKRDRDGLNAMLAAANQGRFGTLYLDSLSRLAREFVLTMPMLKQLVYVDKTRVISVSEGIDSSTASWELMAIFQGWMAGEYIKALRLAVLRGLEDVVLNGWSVGDWCFGYASEPIPDSEVHRRGRDGKPRMRVIINEDHAGWVRKIFHWFVEENKSMSWITRNLTRLKAPKDHRSTKEGWHPDYVRRVLRNEKYIGVWPWGQKTNVRNPLTGQLVQEARPAEEAAKWIRLHPHLRIIDDATFFKAQAILDENEAKLAAVRRANGQLVGSRSETGRARHTLQGLFKCAACGCTLQIVGSRGGYFGCAGYKRGLCTCRTQLRRDLAEAKILEAITNRIFAQPAWLDVIVQEAQNCWSERENSLPQHAVEISRKLAAVKSKIGRLIDAVESGGSDLVDLQERLQRRKREKQSLEQELARLEASASPAKSPPTRDWIESKLKTLHAVLQSGGPEANSVLRKLLGGHVLVEEGTSDGRKRKHMVGRFTISTKTILAGVDSPLVPEQEVVAVRKEEIIVDFRVLPQWMRQAGDVKAALDTGLNHRELAQQMACSRTQVGKIRAQWFKSQGLAVPDGRKLRKRSPYPAQAVALADAVKQLLDEGLAMKEIAARLKCDKGVVTAAMRCWYEKRGLPVPDGRHRRKELNEIRRA